MFYPQLNDIGTTPKIYAHQMTSSLLESSMHTIL